MCEQSQQSTEEPKSCASGGCAAFYPLRPLPGIRRPPAARTGRFGLRRFRAKLNPFGTHRDRLRPEIRYDVASLKNPACAVSRSRRTIFPQVMKKSYTDKQGQYLASIYYYGKLPGCAHDGGFCLVRAGPSCRGLRLLLTWGGESS